MMQTAGYSLLLEKPHLNELNRKLGKQMSQIENKLQQLDYETEIDTAIRHPGAICHPIFCWMADGTPKHSYHQLPSAILENVGVFDKEDDDDEVFLLTTVFCRAALHCRCHPTQ